MCVCLCVFQKKGRITNQPLKAAALTYGTSYLFSTAGNAATNKNETCRRKRQGQVASTVNATRTMNNVWDDGEDAGPHLHNSLERTSPERTSLPTQRRHQTNSLRTQIKQGNEELRWTPSTAFLSRRCRECPAT